MAVVEHNELAQKDPDSQPDPESNVAATPASDAQATGQPEGQQAAAQGAQSTVPDDHPTKLGRRVSKMEERMMEMIDRFDTLMVKMEPGLPTRIPEYEAAQEDIPEHVKETVVAVRKELAKESQREREMQQKYAVDYIKAVQKGYGSTDEELHNAIVKELTETNFQNYKKITGNPLEDAQINYDRAAAGILRRQRAASKVAPNVRGDRENPPTDLSSSSRLDAPPERKIELDEFSRKFLRAIGAKEDEPWVLESLKGGK